MQIVQPERRKSCYSAARKKAQYGKIATRKKCSSKKVAT